MLKHLAVTNVALASLFVLPGLAGQQDESRGLVEQLDATVASIDYLGELAKRVEARDPSALPMLLGATEASLVPPLQREARLVSLRGEVSRLRLALDRIVDRDGPGGLPASLTGVVDPATAGQRRGTDDHVATTPRVWEPGATAPTVGLGTAATRSLTEMLPPLENVEPSAKRRGDEPVALEERDFTADAIRHGKLLFRAGRHAEAIQLLSPQKTSHEARYWLAQALRAMDRTSEAMDLLRVLAEAEDAGAFGRYAKSDLEFLEWKRRLEASRAAREAASAGGARR